MSEVLILTHEYADKSGFQICGVTQNYTVARAWALGGNENHVYRVPLDQILAIHPNSDGWSEWEPE